MVTKPCFSVIIEIIHITANLILKKNNNIQMPCSASKKSFPIPCTYYMDNNASNRNWML